MIVSWFTSTLFFALVAMLLWGGAGVLQKVCVTKTSPKIAMYLNTITQSLIGISFVFWAGLPDSNTSLVHAGGA